MLQSHEIERVLVVVAHPDDVDFGAAGTVANLTDAGVQVTYCIVTDGEAGGSDRTMERHEMAHLRRAEQTAAAACVGVNDLVFLGHPDGRVVADLHLRRDISRVIREVRPDVVIHQSPEIDYDRIFASHPDHRAAGEAALAAVYPDSRNPFAFPELLAAGLEPWTVREVWMTAHPSTTDVVDVTEQIDRKLSALLCHTSQHPDPAAMQVRVSTWMGLLATRNGLPEGRLAEGFRVLATGG